MRCVAISALTSARVWSGWMVSGLTTMPDSNFLTRRTWRGLFLGRQVLVDDAHAAVLRHGDGHVALGDGVHGGGDQRDIQADPAGEAGARCRWRRAGPGNSREPAGRRRRRRLPRCARTSRLPGGGRRLGVGCIECHGRAAFPLPWRPHIGWQGVSLQAGGCDGWMAVRAGRAAPPRSVDSNFALNVSSVAARKSRWSVRVSDRCTDAAWRRPTRRGQPIPGRAQPPISLSVSAEAETPDQIASHMNPDYTRRLSRASPRGGGSFDW